MTAFRTFLFSAACAGLLVGLFVSLLQSSSVVPLIVEAEAYEHAAAASGPAPVPHAVDHAHDHAGWAPEDGFERTAFTVLANIVTATGFALLLVAGYALKGGRLGWYDGLLWGLAGFLTFMLAPSLGLRPELPGMPAAALGPRQLWWIGTAAATACGLWLLAFRRSPLASALAIVLFVAPHLIGAPQSTEPNTLVPEALAHRFVTAVTVTSLLFWAALGLSTAFFFRRFGGSALVEAR